MAGLGAGTSFRAQITRTGRVERRQQRRGRPATAARLRGNVLWHGGASPRERRPATAALSARIGSGRLALVRSRLPGRTELLPEDR
jgi:hypothetical protein